MKLYYGKRTQEGGPEQVMVQTESTVQSLRHYEVHSPDGFQWGYGGSGPADLALAILVDHLGEDPTRKQLSEGLSLAWPLHQDFKWKFVAEFGDSWALRTQDIDAWLKQPNQLTTIAAHQKLMAELEEFARKEANYGTDA